MKADRASTDRASTDPASTAPASTDRGTSARWPLGLRATLRGLLGAAERRASLGIGGGLLGEAGTRAINRAWWLPEGQALQLGGEDLAHLAGTYTLRHASPQGLVRESVEAAQGGWQRSGRNSQVNGLLAAGGAAGGAAGITDLEVMMSGLSPASPEQLRQAFGLYPPLQNKGAARWSGGHSDLAVAVKQLVRDDELAGASPLELVLLSVLVARTTWPSVPVTLGSGPGSLAWMSGEAAPDWSKSSWSPEALAKWSDPAGLERWEASLAAGAEQGDGDQQGAEQQARDHQARMGCMRALIDWDLLTPLHGGWPWPDAEQLEGQRDQPVAGLQTSGPQPGSAAWTWQRADWDHPDDWNGPGPRSVPRILTGRAALMVLERQCCGRAPEMRAELERALGEARAWGEAQLEERRLSRAQLGSSSERVPGWVWQGEYVRLVWPEGWPDRVHPLAVVSVPRVRGGAPELSWIMGKSVMGELVSGELGSGEDPGGLGGPEGVSRQ